MPSRERRTARHTILLVGEGATDAAFLEYIMSLYITRGCGVSAKVIHASGKGPDNVVNHAIRQRQNKDYDRVVTLLDNDLEMSITARKRAKSKKIAIIKTTPCLEGLFLKILGKNVPGSSANCKAQVGIKPPTRKNARAYYQKNFPKQFLDERRNKVSELRRLLDYLLFEE